MVAKPRLGFIGAGRVGTALALCLCQRGYSVVAVASRSLSSAQRLADLVPGCAVCSSAQEVADRAEMAFITTPDDAIAPVAAALEWHRGQSVVFCSGAASAEILSPARAADAEVGGFHPLQTFASIENAIACLPGSTFGIEAEEPLLAQLTGMAGALGGSCIKLSARDKVLYHAGAVMVCNYYVTLVKLAADLWAGFGVAPNDTVKALLPLIKGTIAALEKVGLPGCLTGPITRGDAGTVHKHLEAIAEKSPEILSLYKELGQQTVPIALDKGSLSPEQAEAIGWLLSEPKLREAILAGATALSQKEDDPWR